MSEKPSWPADEAADDAPVGVIRLARAALAAPAPPPEAEHESREQLLAQFHEAALSPRSLHEMHPASADDSLTDRVGRALRLLLGR